MTSPEQKAMMDGIRAASERIKSGASREEEIRLPDGEVVRLSRDEEAPEGFSIESSKGGRSFSARAFGPLSQRPSSYPPDLPFIPQCAVSISVIRNTDGTEEARNAAWMRPVDPEATLDAIARQLQEMGWEKGESTSAATPVGDTRTLLFEKDGSERAVTLMNFGENSQIMLFEKPREEKVH